MITTVTVEVDEDELTAAARAVNVTRKRAEIAEREVWVCPPTELIAATALGYGFTALTDDGDYARQIAAVRPDLSVRMVGDGPD